MDEARVEYILTRRPGLANDPVAQDAAWAEIVKEGLGSSTPFDRHWALYERVFGKRSPAAPPPAIWQPDPEAAAMTHIGQVMAERGVTEYRELHEWSVTHRADFWGDVLGRLGIVFETPPGRILDDSAGPEDPKWLPGASMNIVASCFQADHDAVAIVAGREGVDELRRVTYGELRVMVDQVTAGLRANGWGEGDAIALYMPMTIECVAAYLGIVQAGCAAISIADSFAPREVRTRLEIGDAKGVVTVDSFTRAGKTFALYEKVKEADAPRTIVIAAGEDAPPLRDGDILWEDLLTEGDSDASMGAPERVTNILFSSGTTGDPKAIPWTHLTPIKCGMDGHFHHDIHAGEVVAWPTNIGWMMGPWLIYAALLNRATIALHEGAPNSADFCRFVADARVNMLGLVPALARAWRATDATAGCDWSSVRVLSSTGEASNVEDYLWLMAQTGYRAPVIEYCGGTEIGGGHITGTVVQAASPATFTTAALGLDFVVLDESDAPVPEGGMGTLFLVPPSIGLSQRLLNRDHHEEYFAGCPEGPRGEVLRRHGDAVMRLPGGFWCAQGRADDTMNLGGIKVSSLELERVMDAHPAVYQSAAVGVTPPGGGAERLVVFVVPDGAAPAVAELKAGLQERLSAELNPLFRVADVVLTKTLPRTASNKIMRRKLRAEYQESAARVA